MIRIAFIGAAFLGLLGGMDNCGNTKAEDERLAKIQADLDDLKRKVDGVKPDGPPTAGQKTTVVMPVPSFEMVYVPPGTFQMGSELTEKGRNEDETLHEVTLTKGFWMATTAVTQALHVAVTGEPNIWRSDPPEEKHRFYSTSPCANCAASMNIWTRAIEFCNALSVHTGLKPAYTMNGAEWEWDQSANGYRLPTEAEWEYAARAGERHVYAGSNDVSKVATTRTSNIMPVGQMQPNAWGLYDMSGRFGEWVWDRYGPYPPGEVTDPTGATGGDLRVHRGFNQAKGVRVAIRSKAQANEKWMVSDFTVRLVRNAE